MTGDVILAVWMNFGIAGVETVLLVAIFRKAGFRWPVAAMALGPLLGLILQTILIYLGHVTPGEAISLALPLALLPFLVLAFKSWPIAALPATAPEIFK